MWAGSSGVVGYSGVGHTWGTSQVYYYVNGQSSSLSPSQVISGVQQAAAAWSQQSRANVQLVYGGTTSGSSLTMDYKNQVFFRNAAPGYAGETYWWYDGSGRLVDFDIALYEGSNRFYTGGAGCTGSGIYLEDLVVHEFGHGLGLGHSDAPGATMAAWMPSYCDMTQMTLEPDDIAGIEALYPGGSSPSAPPAAPSQLRVSLNPSNPVSSLLLAWADNASNESGFRIERSTDGYNFAQIAQVQSNTTSYVNQNLLSGTTYYYRVYAYSSAGGSAFSNTADGTTQTAASPSPGGLVLTASGYKAKSGAGVDLRWSGFSSGRIDLYRNGAFLKSTPNDSFEKDSLKKGVGTFSYYACNSGTATCSSVVSVTF